MTSYYNEFDPYAAQWLRNLISAGLIAPGEVDERSITDVRPSELAVFTQCHFFAGIGGWSLALRLAGWPDDEPVWTGSCPCQPFSVAGKGKGADDERHLWPVWFELIRECRPSTVFGEQVAAAVGHNWLDAVSRDMEGEGYAVGAAVLGAHSVGAPHIRQRLWFVADACSAASERDARGVPTSERGERGAGVEDGGGPVGHRYGGADGILADASRVRWDQRFELESNGRTGAPKQDGLGGFSGILADAVPAGRAEWRAEPGDGSPAGVRCPGGMGDTGGARSSVCEGGAVLGEGRRGEGGATEQPGGSSDAGGRPGPLHGFWRDADWLFCRDGKWRPVRPGTFPLAARIPNRVGRLRAYGNAIVPQVAAEFIAAFEECRP